MTKKTNNLLRLVNEKNLFISFVGVFVCLLGLYMYLVSATVMHVVFQTELKQQTKTVHSEISELENRLIIAQHKVSSDIATLQGFTPITEKVFIDRSPDSLVLSDGSLAQ